MQKKKRKQSASLEYTNTIILVECIILLKTTTSHEIVMLSFKFQDVINKVFFLCPIKKKGLQIYEKNKFLKTLIISMKC